jgi:uncharacterized protein YbjT (DUF2867 family)
MNSGLRRALGLLLGAVIAITTTACTATDRAPQTVLVAGATGLTGQKIVQSLKKDGYRAVALVRDPVKARDQLGPDVELRKGDVKDYDSLVQAMSGVQAVISSIGARGKDGPDRPEKVDYEGVKNLVDAAAAANVRQFVLVSSRGVTQESHPLNRMFGNVLIWKLKGEKYLRDSGIAYTIVRPGGLLNDQGGLTDIAFEQGDRAMTGGVMAITREDVATVCVEALGFPEARFRTFEIHSIPGAPVTDWKAKFASLKPDPED